MKINNTLAFLALLGMGAPLFSAKNDNNNNSTKTLYQGTGTDKKGHKLAYETQKPIAFRYDDEELVDVINYIAAQKGANVIMPMGANAITSKVTIDVENPLTINEAWEMLATILDVAGYSIMQKDGMYTIAKTSKEVAKEIMPLFVGMDPEKLPDSDQRIRYLYYLTNIRVPDNPQDTSNELVALFKNLLPDTTTYQFDPRVNAVLISDKANNIRATMTVVAALDKTSFQETVEVLKLRYTSADIVAKLFADILKTSSTEAAKARARGKRDGASYFSDQVKLIPEPRTNKLVVVGKPQAVERVKDFIYRYIDIQMETGESILHVYQLLYLDAVSFAGVLKNIVESERMGGSGQSAAGAPKTGPERFFEGVIIVADQPKGGGKELFFGSNKLVIAAKNDDWLFIKKIIEQLDKPQPQVILEVLVADLTITDLRQIGSSIRNALELPLPGCDMDFQAAQLTQVIPARTSTIGNAWTNPGTIGGDLLGNVFPPPSGTSSIADIVGIEQPGTPGSTLISFNDAATGKTWGLTQLLEIFDTNKILSNPHVIATNNKKAVVTIGDQRLVEGQAVATAAAPTIKRDFIDANLTVAIVPRISASNNVNLQITVNIQNFVPGTNTIATRNVVTNAYVKDGDILALGGLIRTSDINALRETPILGKIPILGWFFKRRRSEERKNNLTVFICPTVVQPRLRGGIDTYTTEYIKLNDRYVNEAQLFDTLRDPVTRFFFRANPDVNNAINEFIAIDESKRDELFLPPPDLEVTPAQEQAIATKRRRNQILTAAEQQEAIKDELAEGDRPETAVM